MHTYRRRPATTSRRAALQKTRCIAHAYRDAIRRTLGGSDVTLPNPPRRARTRGARAGRSTPRRHLQPLLHLQLAPSSRLQPGRYEREPKRGSRPRVRNAAHATIADVTRATLASCLAALAVSGSLAAAAIGTDAGRVRAATRTYVHSFINGPESPLRVRPSIIRVQGSGAISYRRLRWRNWGTSRAQAKGRQCSGRTSACRTANVRLSDRKTMHGRLVYTCLRPLLPGEVKICLP
jgi:hypothetical protein